MPGARPKRNRTVFRHFLAFFAQAIEMNGDRLTHVFLNFIARAARRNTSRQVRRVGGKARVRWFNHKEIFLHFFSPACLKTRLRVPGARSSFRFPGTFTRPILTGCCTGDDFLVFSAEPIHPLPTFGLRPGLSRAKVMMLGNSRQLPGFASGGRRNLSNMRIVQANMNTRKPTRRYQKRSGLGGFWGCRLIWMA